MRAFVPDYQMEAPPTLAAALQRMASEPSAWKPFAGGTDLMVLLEAGKLPHRKFLSIWKIPDLRGIAASSTHVALGALTTYSEVRRDELLGREFPLLARAAAETGSIATQNRGTLGGNIANASPAADTPPALLVYDAELELVSPSGTRVVPFHGFWKGYKQLSLHEDELIRAIRLPRGTYGWMHFYRKVGARRAQAISKVCFAGTARMEGGKIGDLRIALGSVAPVVLRATETEQALRGARPTPIVIRAAQQTLAREIAPINDIRSTAHYRLRVAQNLLAEFCEIISA
jgi:CO/xanthine dehydrogenase FAD-binding subunit